LKNHWNINGSYYQSTSSQDRRRIQVPRAGNSLSFSETEMDSDLEIDLKLERKTDKSTQSTPPATSRTSLRGKEEARGYVEEHRDRDWHWGAKHKDATDGGATTAAHTLTEQEQLQQQQQQQEDQDARAEQLNELIENNSWDFLN